MHNYVRICEIKTLYHDDPKSTVQTKKTKKLGPPQKTIFDSFDRFTCWVLSRISYIISNLKMVRHLVFEQIKKSKKGQGQKSKFGSDIPTSHRFCSWNLDCIFSRICQFRLFYGPFFGHSRLFFFSSLASVIFAHRIRSKVRPIDHISI